LGNRWNTTLWNDAFTQPLTQTVVLAPGEAQRLGVRVQIPSGATPRDLDVALLRASTASGPAAWADGLLVTRVSRPAPGQFGVHLQPAGRLGEAAPLSPVTHVFTVTNVGAEPDSFDLAVSDATWLVHAPFSTSELGPGASEAIPIIVWVPEGAVSGAWDRLNLLATSRGDPAAQDAAAAVTVSRAGKPVGHRVYVPVVAKRGLINE
jgi:hypothetical protein